MKNPNINSVFSRHWALTYFLADEELLQDVFDKVDNFMSFYINSHFLIGEEEFTSTEKRHCHIVLSFKSAISFDSIKKNFSSQHIERVRNIKDCLNYSKKMGVYFSSYEECVSRKNDVYKEFVDDVLLDMSLRDLIKKYPQFFLRNYNNTINLIKVLKGIDVPYNDKDSSLKHQNIF